MTVVLSDWTHLVQWSYRDLCDVVGDEFPGGALRVTGSDALSVPQVICSTVDEEEKTCESKKKFSF